MSIDGFPPGDPAPRLHARVLVTASDDDGDPRFRHLAAIRFEGGFAIFDQGDGCSVAIPGHRVLEIRITEEVSP